MNVLILLSFNAPFGGLQENALAQAKCIQGAGGRAIFFLTPGPFADCLEADGFAVVRDTSSTPEEEAKRVLKRFGDVIDIIHTHPFRAREVACAVKELIDRPLVLTIHSLYDAGLRAYADDVDFVLTVSDAARDHLISNQLFVPERTITLHNGVDLSVYNAIHNSSEILIDQYSLNRDVLLAGRKRALLVTRLDADKAFITDIAEQIWQLQAKQRTNDITWIIAGDGSERARLENLAREAEALIGGMRFVFTGWCDQDKLRTLYSWADVALAPGRCALEAMACGLPTIAIGSKGYVGPAPGFGEYFGRYTNFGGMGRRPVSPERVLSDLEGILYKEENRDELAVRARRFVETHYDQTKIDDRLLDLYENLAARAKQRRPQVTTQGMTELRFDAAIWCITGDVATTDDMIKNDGTAEVQANLSADQKIYISMNGGNFKRLRKWRAFQDCASMSFVDIRVKTKIKGGGITLDLYVLFFRFAGEHIKSKKVPLRSGENSIRCRIPPGAARFALAFRVAGVGLAQINPPQILLPTYAASSAINIDKRLIFIVGPPRSGTSWLWNMLRSHDDVIAASEDNLRIRTKERETIETNIFNPALKFSTSQIRKRFEELALEFPDKHIVEKTPLHMLHLDRIYETFPGANIVQLKRDPRAVIASLLKVGRNTDAWWQGAPKDIDKAIALALPYFNAAWRAERSYLSVIMVGYNDLFTSPTVEFEALLERLCLDTTQAASLVERTAGGRNFPIKGVFQGGAVDSWQDYLSQAELAVLKQSLCDSEAGVLGPVNLAPVVKT